MSIDVAEWLKALGLERYEPAFAANDIDAEVLSELTADDLTGIGVSSIGHRRKLLAAIAHLRSNSVHRDALPLEGFALKGACDQKLGILTQNLPRCTR